MKKQIIFKVIDPCDSIPISHDFDLKDYRLDAREKTLLIDVSHAAGADVVHKFTLFHDKILHGKQHEGQQLRLTIVYNNGGNTLEACARHTIKIPLEECFSKGLIAEMYKSHNPIEILIVKSLSLSMRLDTELYAKNIVSKRVWSSE